MAEPTTPTNIPIIFRGDDTDFQDDSRLSVSVTTDYALEGCTLEADLQGLRTRFASVTNGASVAFRYTARQTASFRTGVHKIRFRLFDAQGRVRTLAPMLVIVSDDPSVVYEQIGQQSEIEFTRNWLVLNESNILDCGVTLVDLKKRIAYLWRKLGGSVANEAGLDI